MRMDHGSQSLSDQFKYHIKFFGITFSFAVVAKSEINGKVERLILWFFKTLTQADENLFPIEVEMTIATRLTDYDNKNSLVSVLRAKRIQPLLKMIENLHRKNGKVRILDVGGTLQYWSILPKKILKEYDVSILIANISEIDLFIDIEHFSSIIADGCDLGIFDDNSFDIVHSNSVLEHVGDWQRKVNFALEVRRIAKNYFVQTPNYWFPIEPHCRMPFFHWLPKPFRVFLIMHFNLGYWERAKDVDKAVRTVESARLVTKSMLQWLFPDSQISTERFLVFPKSFIAICDNTRL